MIDRQPDAPGDPAPDSTTGACPCICHAGPDDRPVAHTRACCPAWNGPLVGPAGDSQPHIEARERARLAEARPRDLDADAEALAWARAKIERARDKYLAGERRARARGDLDLATRCRRYANLLQMEFIGDGRSCVIAAFDERRPVFARDAPADAPRAGEVRYRIRIAGEFLAIRRTARELIAPQSVSPSTEVIVLDFAGVQAVTAAFVDELLATVTAAAPDRRIRIEGAIEAVREVLEVVLQRRSLEAAWERSG